MNPLHRAAAGIPSAVVMLLALCLGGCYTMEPRRTVSLDEVVRMSKSGTPPNEIIATLQHEYIQTEFSGSQFARLKEQGVSDEVLDFLFNAHANRIRGESRVYAEPLWWYYPSHYYGPRTIVVEKPRR